MSVFLEKLGRNERRAGGALALIYAFRMFGLFMIMPVFAFANACGLEIFEDIE